MADAVGTGGQHTANHRGESRAVVGKLRSVQQWDGGGDGCFPDGQVQIVEEGRYSVEQQYRLRGGRQALRHIAFLPIGDMISRDLAKAGSRTPVDDHRSPREIR